MRRFTTLCVVSAAMLGTGSCTDHNVVSPELTLPTDFVISNSIVTPIGVAYVSAPPGTFSTGNAIAIENITRHTQGPRAFLVDGGFDPIPIEANESDEIRFTVIGSNGTLITKTLKVPGRRPPTIVRTDPTKGRVDIALNVSVTVVFSEPVDPRTISTESVYLLENGKRVAGSVGFGNQWTVMFIPSKSLDANSSYELVVTSAVRDPDGDALEGQYNASFTTGSIPASPPPVPTGGNGQISGTVVERTPDGFKPVPGVTVFTWVERGSPGDWGYSRGGTITDAQGKFTVTDLPAATLVLTAAGNGYDQPCFKIISFNGGPLTTEIEVVPQAHPSVAAATAPPVVKGVVYELTPSGRQPVAGATLYLDRFDDHNFAWTTTDENGRYQFCRVVPWHNFGPQVYAGKEGYQWSYNLLTLGGEQEVVLDIELKR